MNKHPLWYKLTIYSLYAIIIVILFMLMMSHLEVVSYETQAAISENTAHPPAMLKRMYTKPLTASWYDYKIVGKTTAVCNHEKEKCYTESHNVAASRKYVRGTQVVVCRKNTDKCVQVKITDYIEHPDRDIDLSSYAFSQLGSLSLGLMNVTISEVK